jgi:hypothetical protein
MVPIALLSQVISFSPDAGLRKDVVVVVVTTERVVVEITAGDVEDEESADAAPQETRPKRRGRSRNSLFTSAVCQSNLKHHKAKYVNQRLLRIGVFSD